MSLSVSDIFFSLLLPPACVSAVMLILLFFIYISIHTKQRDLWAIVFLALNIFGYAVFSLLISYDIFLFSDAKTVYQFYFYQQLVTAFFTFTVPNFFAHFDIRLRFVEKFFHKLTFAGLFLAAFIILSVFFEPSLFLAISDTDIISLPVSPDIVEFGILYNLRDLLLSIEMLTALVYYIYSVFRKDKRIRSISILLAIVFAINASLFSIICDHFGEQFSCITEGVFLFPDETLALTVLLVVLSTLVVRDIFHRSRLTEEAVSSFRRSEDNLRQIGKNVNEIVWITDYPQTQIVYINTLFKQLFNIQMKQLFNDVNCWMSKVHPDDYDSVYGAFFENEIQDSFEIEYRIQSRRKISWLRDRAYPVRDKDGKVYRLIRIIEDISERKMTQEKLSFMAYHDQLTGLYNRKAMFEMVSESLLQMTRIPDLKLKAILFIDLDNFKNINETSGHGIGDRLLCYVSERILNTVRETDHIFRFGGDEFVVVLNHLEHEYACSAVAQKLISKLSRPYMIEDEKLFIGVSIGIALYPRDGINIEDLVKNADIALREAKKNRNSFSFYNTAMNIRAMERVKTERDLRKAYDNHEFSLNFQPIYGTDKTVISTECLIRWQREGKNVSPSKFIPIAEESDLIVTIGEWVIEEVCRCSRKLKKEGLLLPLAINISPRHFKTETFVERFEQILSRFEVEPSDIEIEITEGVMVENPADAILKMQKLNRMGINFSIDDFGTGYSSLSYIKQFPIKSLKIDRCFISDLEKNIESRKITNAIVAMAHSLGLTVIAEGVETGFQHEYLGSVKCDLLQGYFLSRPLDFDRFRELLVLPVEEK